MHCTVPVKFFNSVCCCFLVVNQVLRCTPLVTLEFFVASYHRLCKTTESDTSEWVVQPERSLRVTSQMWGNQTEDPNVARYYHDVGKTEILSARDERALFHNFSKTRDPQVRERILGSALRFVIKLAKNYSRDVDTTKDLISAGNVGLLKAFDRYDLSYGTRFLSYATSWVLLEMRNELYSVGTVSMPLWRQKVINKISQAHTRAMSQQGRKASVQELQKCVDLNPTQIQRLLNCEALCITCLDENDLTDRPGSGRKTIDSRLMDKESRALVGQLIKMLPTVKEQFVIKAYFGWVSDPLSLRQIAGVLGVSSERVRQVKVDALRRIRKQLRYQLSIERSSDLSPGFQ